MKKVIVLAVSLIFVCILPACTKGVESCPAAEEGFAEEAMKEEISSQMIGQGIYDALKKEWDTWNGKSKEQKMLSSHLPGNCYKSFESWADCEEFLGFELFNPLEESDWPEKATYVGMPLGYADASRFYVSFYGENAKQVKWIFVESGYRDGDIRITVDAQVFVDVAKENTDELEPLITEDSGEMYVATTALVAQGPVMYNIRVIGEPGKQTEVQETLKKVLPYFKDDAK